MLNQAHRDDQSVVRALLSRPHLSQGPQRKQYCEPPLVFSNNRGCRRDLERGRRLEEPLVHPTPNPGLQYQTVALLGESSLQQSEVRAHRLCHALAIASTDPRTHTHTTHTHTFSLLPMCPSLLLLFCAQDSVRKGVVRAVNAVKSYQRKPRGRPHDRAKRDNLSCDGLQIAKKKKTVPGKHRTILTNHFCFFSLPIVDRRVRCSIPLALRDQRPTRHSGGEGPTDRWLALFLLYIYIYIYI